MMRIGDRGSELEAGRPGRNSPPHRCAVSSDPSPSSSNAALESNASGTRILPIRAAQREPQSSRLRRRSELARDRFDTARTARGDAPSVVVGALSPRI